MQRSRKMHHDASNTTVRFLTAVCWFRSNVLASLDRHVRCIMWCYELKLIIDSTEEPGSRCKPWQWIYLPKESAEYFHFHNCHAP